jgi:hypothetical protein
VILIVVLGITFLDKSVTPAWAIEDTIDLISQYNGIYFTGTTLDEQGKEMFFEAWARANEEQTASDSFRLESSNGQVFVVFNHVCHRYDPQTNVVTITEGYGPAISPWPGAQLLETLKKTTFDWNESYGKDPATDRDRVFVTCSHPAAPEPRSWWFEVDIESKLLVGMKQWENMVRKGIPRFHATSIKYFEDLPDELFHFEIPKGAQTVTHLPELMDKLNDPNSGMLIGNMIEEQACAAIARRYWQAIIEHDWQTVAILRPIATAQQWEDKYSGVNFEEIIEIGKPRWEGGCTIGQIVSCTIRFNNIVIKTINMVILFRETDGQKSCVIAGTWGKDVEIN